MDHVHKEGFLFGTHIQRFEFELDGLAGHVHFDLRQFGSEHHFGEDARNTLQTLSPDTGRIDECVAGALAIADATVLLELLENFIFVRKLLC